jgi:spermidine synthase
VKPQIKLDEVRTPDGGRLTLHSHDQAFSIRLNGQELMHSAAGLSERELGEQAVARVRPQSPARILIGGLGLGFTLDAVLDRVGPQAQVEVVELIPAVVEWNRTALEKLNGGRLSDPRVTTRVEDVGDVLRRTPAAHFDAIVLDVDNGPAAMVGKANGGLYTGAGIAVAKRALKVGGRLAVWSASADAPFAKRLSDASLKVTIVPAKLHANARRATYVLYLADKG